MVPSEKDLKKLADIYVMHAIREKHINARYVDPVVLAKDLIARGLSWDLAKIQIDLIYRDRGLPLSAIKKTIESHKPTFEFHQRKFRERRRK